MIVDTLVKIVAVVLIGGLFDWASGMTSAPVHLACVAHSSVPEAKADLVCDAMAEVLGDRYPGRDILRTEAMPDDALRLTVEITEHPVRKVSAVLSWVDGALSGASPEISVRIVDAEIGLPTYRQLCQELLKTAQTPP